MTIRSILMVCTALLCSAKSQDFMNFQLEQERIRCIGVRCPADKPRCVVENDVVRCVAISTNADGNGGGYTGRLSRAPRPLFQPQPAVVNILSPNDNMYQPNNGISPTSTNKGAMLTFISDINPDGVFGQPTTRGNVHQGQTSTPPSLPTNFDSSSPARRGIDASNSAQNFQTQNQGFPTFQENVNPNRPAANNQAQRNGASRRCFQAVNPGNCRAYIPRYFFNPSSQHCESFVYGGCGGNENNFENLSDCFRLCVLPQANNNALNEGNPAVSSDHNERRNIAQNPSIQSDVNSLFNKDLFFTSSDANSFSTLINANNANSEKVPQAPSGHSSGFAPGAPPPPPGLCSLNADPGVCLGNSPRYFYNANSQRCERFTFGGCGGNRNNFRTFEECKSTCDYFDDYINGQSNGQLGNSRTNTRPTDNFGQNSPNYPRNPPASPVSQQPRGFAPGAPPAAPRSCFMPADAGPCLRRVQRFYFNPQSQRCESFSFGGCGGNQNNFATMDDCKTTCDYFDEYVNQQSSGGVGTGTVIDDSAAYRAKGGVPTPPGLRCRLRPDPGPCTGSRPRYFYNTNSKRCEGFTYGGCDGNENNFLTLIDCRNACDQFVEQRNVDLSQQIPSMMPQPTTDGVFRLPALPSNQLSSGQNFQASRPNVNNANRPTRPDSSTPGDQNSRPSFCYQRAQTGLCRAYIKRYFYNTNTGRCEQFVYGGCRPNQNNFQTENECKQACVGNAGGNVKPEADRQTVNSLFENPSSPAPFGSFRLARDNAGSRTLSLRPNFSNEDSNNRPVVNRPNHQQPAPDRVTSVSNRQTQTNVCTFPVDFGSCFQHIPSYYYDSNSGTCQAFIFRGCGGNQNRFSSFLQCESQCSGRNSGGSNDADALSFPSFPSIF